MTDRALLELAAKAAGIVGKYNSWCYHGFNEGIRIAGTPWPWNPLGDDGQALRLAVKLRLMLIPLEGGGWDVYRFDPLDYTEVLVATDSDPRRAIVHAAAAIGETK